MYAQSTGGARPKTRPLTPEATLCSKRHREVVWIKCLALKATIGAIRNGNERNWHSTQSKLHDVPLVKCPA